MIVINFLGEMVPLKLKASEADYDILINNLSQSGENRMFLNGFYINLDKVTYMNYEKGDK